MQLPEHANKISLPGFEFDLVHLELHDAAGKRVALRPRALAVLNCLARNAGHVVTKDQLMQAAWPGVVVTDDSLVQCIGELRKVLQDRERRVLQTDPRRGYRLATLGEESHGARTPSTEANSFRQEIRFATSVDGVRIAYATSGTGPALVRTAHWMTHLEWDWRSAVYGDSLVRLSRSHRLVRYDSRGCGLSDRGALVATLDEEIQDLEAVIDDAGLEQFALFGRSQGGAIAIRYAALHPERVSKLVILAGFARGELRRGARSSSPEKVQAFARVLEEGWGDSNSAVRQIWTTWLFPGATAEQQDSFNHMQRVACSPQRAVSAHLAACSIDTSDDLRRVRCPTLVLHNPDDAIVPFEEGRLIASGIVGARLQPFTSRNHSPLPGEPAFDQVMRHIDEFLHSGPPAKPLTGGRASLRIVQE